MSRKVSVDWESVQRDLGGKDFTDLELAELAGVSNNTVRNARNQNPMQRKTALKVVTATGIRNPHSYLSAVGANGSTSQAILGSFLHDWEIEEKVIERNEFRNIPYKVAKGTHRTNERVGRIKVFDLSDFGDDVIELLEMSLARNPIVCAKLERHPNIALFYENGFATQDKYWAIEKWEDVSTLENAVLDGILTREKVPKLAMDLASTLNAINKVGIVRRCLSPRNICIREDGSLLLRDFELSTFAQGSISGPLDFDPNPFYAPEFNHPQKDIDVRADLYSWAQVVTFCITGKRPQTNYEHSFWDRLPVPKAVGKVLETCTQPTREFRTLVPKSKKEKSDFEDVLELISDWSAES